MKSIEITTKKQLDIYMNPQRQRLLKSMELEGKPMTPKQLSQVLEISPSSVTYHLKKLEELGLVELHHTEMIRGICARFYQKVPVTINLGAGEEGDLKREKETLMDYMINDIYNGFKGYMNDLTEEEKSAVHGDIKHGVYYLTKTEAAELQKMIGRFLESHTLPKEDAEPWEVALLAYPRKRPD